jgi:hypothetical protein
MAHLTALLVTAILPMLVSQIAAILIRNVTGEAAQGERLRRAVEGIEWRRWQLFRRPEQLRELSQRLSQPREAAR